ncbi:SDR family oxidoreductase [Variovorax sp. KK3]|uniref:SDR family oxidoreductase n=1 Tax=Variovorax sp. KK3 TaxID=1855728 RepID=UPI00097C90D4|nr:SDR family oxidoreductase [Variovorax sp. KK3]
MTFIDESAGSPGNCPGWALVTGGSGRGGAAIVRALHARGLSVVIHHTPLSLDRASALQRELEAVRPGTVDLWSADFAAGDFSIPAWLASKGVTVMVCNASAYRGSRVGDIERAQIDIAIHVGAHAGLLDALRPRPGQSPPLQSVVAITDIAVDRAPRGHVSYTTAKGALQSMILALANDWAPHVRFNVVQPGTLPYPEDWTDTARENKIKETIPLGRIGTFEELAGAVAYLAIDATYVTGQVLAVDGGRSRQLY